MNYKWNEDELVFEFPKTVYNFNLTDRGDVLELRNSLFKEKFGDFLNTENTGLAYNIFDLSKRLRGLGYEAVVLEDKKLFVAKDGINIYVLFSKYLAYENTTVKQIEFTMKGLKEEREGILKNTVEGFQRQMLEHNEPLNSGVRNHGI